MGFGERAAMLNRSLFEDIVDIHWICTKPEDAVRLYEDHHEHGRMLLADQVAKYPDMYANLEIPEFSKEERTSWTPLDPTVFRHDFGEAA